MLFKREKGYLISFFYIRDDEYSFSSVSITSKKKIKINDIDDVKEELKRILFFTNIVILNVQKLPI